MPVSLTEYLNRARLPPEGQRLGQWAFNLLEAERPDLAAEVRGTSLDPFYLRASPEFWAFVMENW